MAPFGRDTTGEEVAKTFARGVEGKVIVITGPSAGGIGAETAISLASANPKQLILLGRTEAKISPVLDEIKKINPAISAKFIKLDLGNLSSVREAASTINERVSHIDVLINNAGIMAVKQYTKTVDGFESQLATNHLGHFLLTNLLMGKLLAAGEGAKIVNLSSMGYELSEFRFDDWNFSDGATYHPWSAYAQSKTANILFTHALARKLADKGVFSFAIQPGYVPDSKLQDDVTQEMFMEGYNMAVERMGPDFIGVDPPKSLQCGSSTTLVAALDPALTGSSSAFLQDCAIREGIKEYATSAENVGRLWALSEELVGEKFAY
ncbi:MAG: hypothetical protein FRX48_08056 [Lasallia pustulata]|uniref:Short-chain dehydrogenase n=1 Tax=Lasallia pustulata TaxID=136370 RepID=A0A5M8PHP9_9LECA|nr:MAG: hypothetical protein FRX48_08056 [Lasallia pustulata]